MTVHSGPRMFDTQESLDVTTYPWADEFTTKIWESFWTPSKFDFKADVQQFHTEMSELQRGVSTRTLVAISQVEYNVKEFWARLGDWLPHPELKDLGRALANCEVIHSKAYRKKLDKLGLHTIFRELLAEPVFAERVRYLSSHLAKVDGGSRRQRLYSVIIFTLFVENVSLFGQFYTILWMNRNLAVLKDTSQQIQYTRNEEMLHAQVGTRIVRTLREEYPELFDQELEDLIISEARRALAAEKQITRWMLGEYRSGPVVPGGGTLSPEVVDSYVEARMDDGLVAMGFPPINVRDPALCEQWRWMDEEAFGNNSTDFFHKEPVDYAKHNRSYSTEDLF